MDKHLFLYLVGLFKFIFGVPGNPTDPLATFDVDHAFKLTTISDLVINKVQYFPSSQNKYMLGETSGGNTAVMKFDSNDDIVWLNVYYQIPVSFAFVVTPDESIVYFMKAMANENLYGVNTADGSMYSVVNTTSFKMQPTEHFLYISQDGTALFYTTETPSIVRWIRDQDNITSISVLLSNKVLGVEAINDTIIYATSQNSVYNTLFVRMLNYSSLPDPTIWGLTINGPTSSCNNFESILMFNAARYTVYGMMYWEKRSAFFLLDPDTGDSILGSNLFLRNSNGTNFYITRMMMTDDLSKIYITARCITTLLFVYDVNSDQFIEEYGAISPNYFFYDMYLDPNFIGLVGYQVVSGVNNAWDVKLTLNSIDRKYFVAY